MNVSYTVLLVATFAEVNIGLCHKRILQVSSATRFSIMKENSQ